MLRRQFLQLISDLRAELERSSDPAVGVSDLPTLKQKINRVYETLYADYDWPHLTQTFNAIPLQAGQRYYDPPETMDFDRMEEVVTWYNDLPVPLERGIGFDDYASYNSETGDTSDPALKWDIRFDETGNKEVIEIWPIPASNSPTIQFRGIRKFARLVDDADRCRLDDQLVILFAAADLAEKKDDKQFFLAQAKDRLSQVRKRGKSGASRVKIGGAGEPQKDFRAVVRIAG